MLQTVDFGERALSSYEGIVDGALLDHVLAHPADNTRDRLLELARALPRSEKPTGP